MLILARVQKRLTDYCEPEDLAENNIRIHPGGALYHDFQGYPAKEALVDKPSGDMVCDELTAHRAAARHQRCIVLRTKFLHGTNVFIAYPPNMTVSEAIARFREDAKEIETVYYIYLIDEAEKLIGVVSLRELLLSDPDTRLSEIMELKVKTVNPEEDEKVVAKITAKYNLVALPVVDAHGVLLGVVTVDDILGRILPAKRK